MSTKGRIAHGTTPEGGSGYVTDEFRRRVREGMRQKRLEDERLSRRARKTRTV